MCRLLTVGRGVIPHLRRHVHVLRHVGQLGLLLQQPHGVGQELRLVPGGGDQGAGG